MLPEGSGGLLEALGALRELWEARSPGQSRMVPEGSGGLLEALGALRELWEARSVILRYLLNTLDFRSMILQLVVNTLDFGSAMFANRVQGRSSGAGTLSIWKSESYIYIYV